MSKDFLLKIVVPPVATYGVFAALSKYNDGKVDRILPILAASVVAVASVIFYKLPLTHALFATSAAIGAIYYGTERYMNSENISETLASAAIGALAGTCVMGALYGIQKLYGIHKIVRNALEFLKTQEVTGWTVMNGQIVPIFGPKPQEIK